MSFRLRAALLSLFLLVPASTLATGQWVAVDSGGRESVALDRASIAGDAGEVLAWSRIRLERVVRDAGGDYDGIHAQNRYDCAGRRFTTLERAYFLGDRKLRSEPVASRRSQAAQAGSLDARLLDIACGQPPASPAAGGLPERAQAMHADLRRLEEGETARAFAVADSAGERPKLIQLPTIDRAAAAAAAREAAQKAGEAGKQAAQEPKAKDAAAAKAAPRTPAAAKAAIPRDKPATDERRLRELQYANSGPARTARRKAAGEALLAELHWSYEGETGPAHWARLNPAYAACAAGKRQSPIDIRDGIRVDLEPIRFDYKPTSFRIVDLGHTLQVNLPEGGSLTVMGKRYSLLQFHLHRPAEERVNGRAYDLGLHFVHRNDEGQLAVVAVLLEKGSDHPLLQTLLNHLPLEQNVEVAPETSLDLSRLLPENRAYWTYMGSLTTPPCTEGVLWMVLKQPLQLGAEQLAILGRVLRANARPLQPGHGRLVKESR
jgi:carbonic anhydrase